MVLRRYWICCGLMAGIYGAAQAQDAKQLVQQAVATELAADQNDHSRWIYFDIDRKPRSAVSQWVAETSDGRLERVLEADGRKLSQGQQISRMEDFLRSPGEQERRRKANRHDDEEATELLRLLPNAFAWTVSSHQNGNILLHFRPEASFHPPNREARVFASMEGDMALDDVQHRIVSLKGHLVRDVKFGGGLFAELKAGGTFDVERRELTKGIWQITETHVHIEGHALLFKSISEQEDEVKTKFQQLPDDISMEQAEKKLLQEGA